MVIVQYWHSEEVPADVAELIGTFRDRNPDLRHLLFHQTDAATFIADHFGERELAAFRSCAVPAMQADYFRYCAVLTLGGVYSDVSFRCLRPLRTLTDTTAGGQLFSKETQGKVINGFFLFRSPGHPLLRLALEVATSNIELRVAENVNLVTGPWVFSGLWALHGAGSFGAFRQTAASMGLERLAESFISTIGDYSRVSKAFEDVRVAPLDTAMGWVGSQPQRPRYKSDDDDWINWRRKKLSIYR